ncbi:MAG: hypothetical protein HY033_13505 [Ignavibacteriae bacterium]|nr:hypothetical protein [Ignavibacteria bacterium]MBI3365908.1 hypothetical protein [Ignavibacteriota bacterium]
MVQRKQKKPSVVTQHFVKQELNALEIRLNNRLDFKEQSFKEYVVSRLSPVTDRLKNLESTTNDLTTGIQDVRGDIAALGDKLDMSAKGIVQMVERLIGMHSRIEEKVDNHEQRITTLEARA